MNNSDIDPVTHLLTYHTEMLRMAESVRAMYSRYLPLFILACAETVALFVSCALKVASDPSMHNFLQWVQAQPMLYVNLALLPPLFILGYMVLLLVLMQREQFYEKRADSVRHEIEKTLQTRSDVVLQGEPVTSSLLERVIHRPTETRQPMVPPMSPRVPEQRIGMTPPPPPPNSF